MADKLLIKLVRKNPFQAKQRQAKRLTSTSRFCQRIATARPDGCSASPAFRFLGSFESNPPVQIQRCAINFIVLDSRGHQDSGASKASDQENDRLLHRAYAHAVGRWQAGHGPIFLSSSFKDLQSFCEQPSCSRV